MTTAFCSLVSGSLPVGRVNRLPFSRRTVAEWMISSRSGHSCRGTDDRTPRPQPDLRRGLDNIVGRAYLVSIADSVYDVDAALSSQILKVLMAGPFVNGAPSGMTLAEEAYARINQMLLEGEIPPNGLVREADLVRRLGLTRTPIREALVRLQAEGVLQAIPSGGYLVVEIDVDDLREVYDVRAVLESHAARLAAQRRTRTDIAQLEDLFEEMERAISAGDEALLAQLNSRFHETIAIASRNTYLQSMLGNIRNVFERYRRRAVNDPGRRTHSHDEHRDLIDAIRAGDADRAAEIIDRHVRRALDFRLGAAPIHASEESR